MLFVVVVVVRAAEAIGAVRLVGLALLLLERFVVFALLVGPPFELDVLERHATGVRDGTAHELALPSAVITRGPSARRAHVVLRKQRQREPARFGFHDAPPA